MTKSDYTTPSRIERQVLAVLATVEIMVPALTYNGLLWEDIEARLPRGIKKRELARALRNLKDAEYIKEGATYLFQKPGIFQTFHITAAGMRVTLGVLG